MSGKTLSPKPLTQSAFAPFGHVLETTDKDAALVINEGHTLRFDNLADLDLLNDQGEPCVSIFRSTPLASPLIIRLMECHPLGSQTFYPLSGNPYLVVVAPPGELQPDKIQVFLASPNQGVNYHTGTWHHYSLALDRLSDFLVIDRRGPGNNLQEVTLAEEDQIRIVMD